MKPWPFVVAVIVLAAILIGNAPLASADATFTFATTAAFDAGTKSSVDTSTNSCLVPSNAFGLNASTPDYFGISSLCAMGSPSVSTGSLLLSYDMETLASGKMKDFSGNGNDGTITGTSFVTGKYGQGTQFVALNGNNVDAGTGSRSSATSFSISFWAKWDGTNGANYMDLFQRRSGASTVWAQVTFEGSTHKPIMYDGAVRSFSTSSAFPSGAWTNLIFVETGGSVTLYQDCTSRGSSALTVANPAANVIIGDGPDGSFAGVLDEVLVSTRAWTAGEIAAVCTSGSRATSGHWASASQSATGSKFTSLSVAYTGASASQYIAGVALVDNGGSYFYVDNTHLTSGTSHTYTVPNVVHAVAWTVRVNMTGDGTGTALVSSVSVDIVDTPPVITGKIASDAITVDAFYAHHFVGSDADLETVTWTLATSATGLSIGASNGTVWGVVHSVGTYTVNVTITDTSARFDFDNYTLSVTNTAPRLIPIVSLEAITRGDAFSLQYSASDPDANQTLNWTFTTNLPGLSFGPSNHTVYGSPTNLGTWYYNVSVTDGHASVWDNVTFTVNEPKANPTGADWLAVGLVLFLTILFLLLGFVHPAFHVMGGIMAILFGIWLFAFVDTYICIMFIALGLSMFAMAISRPGPPRR